MITFLTSITILDSMIKTLMIIMIIMSLSHYPTLDGEIEDHIENLRKIKLLSIMENQFISRLIKNSMIRLRN